MLRLFNSGKNPEKKPDFSALGIDFHSHLLPGIDDGAPNLETALELIRGLVDLGFHTVYTSPHVMSDLYPNTRDIILRKRDEVQEAVAELGIPVRFETAAEYFIDESFAELFKKEPLLTLPGNRVLVELSTLQPYRGLENLLFELQIKGYRPIMAHPERYPYYTLDKIERLEELGCELQVNILSFTGYYARKVREMARKLLDNNLVSYIATDLHHDKHLEKLRSAVHEPLVQKAMDVARNAAMV